MKKLNLYVKILMLIICANLEIFSQTRVVVGPDTSTFRRFLCKSQTGPVIGCFGTGLMNLYTFPFVGYDGTIRYRLFYQWQLPDNLIPNGSTIDTVQIIFEGGYVSNSINLIAMFYNISHDLINPNLDTLWARSDRTRPHIGYSESEGDAYGSGFKIDATFGRGSAFTSAVQNSLNDDKFVLGVTAYSENRWDYQWRVYNWTVKLRIVYTKPNVTVNVDQKLEGSNISVDSIGRWETNHFKKYSIPKSFIFDVGDNEVLEASRKIISNQKYNNWNQSSNVENHQIFPIQVGTTQLTSNFKSTFGGCTFLRPELIELQTTPNPNYGHVIQIKDPWVIDYSDTRFYQAPYGYRNLGMSAPYLFESLPCTLKMDSKYKGVFLNQGDPADLKPPYYSVRVPQVENIGGYNANFGFWSGEGATVTNPTNLETPVIFNNSNAVVKANYKLPMKSNLSTALTGNSQRKLIDYGGLWLAYESAGRIWVAKSTDGANSWIPENYVGEGSKPSLSGNYSSDLVYQKLESNNTYSIYWKCIYGTPSGETRLISSVPASIEPKPVVTRVLIGNTPTWGNKYNLHIVWKDISGIKYKAATIEYTSVTFGGVGTISSNPACQNPSISTSYLTYDNNAKIYLRKLNISSSGSSWGNEEIVPASDREDLGYANDRESRKSQVTSAGDIVWEVGNYIPFIEDPIDANSFQSLALSPGPGNPPPSPPKSAIFYQKRNSDGTYGAAISWSGSFNFYNPIVASYNGNITVMWETGVNTYRVSSPNLGIGSAFITAGVNPNLASNQLKYAYLTSSAPLYNLNVQPQLQVIGPEPIDSCEIVVCDEDPGNGYDVMRSRSGIIWSVSDSTRFEVTIGQPKLFGANGSVARIPFEKILGSADVTSIDNLVELLKTKPFKLTKDSLRVGGRIIVKNPNGLIIPGTPFGKLKFEVVDATTGNVLMRLGNEMAIEQSSKIRFNSKASVKNLEGRTVYIRPRFVGFPKKNLSGTIVNNYYLKNIVPSSQAISKSNTNEEVNNIPSEYALSQNYPNPFNPATVINYQLPVGSWVTLKVYDVLGREVATLVNEMQDAGYKSVTFNAENLSSGVYFYKLTAGSYTAVKKLLITK